jgi:hypothetical protein
VYAGNYAARGISNSLSTVAFKLLSNPQDELYYRIRFKIISQAQTMNLMKFRTKDPGYGKSILGVYVSNTGYLGIRNDTLPLTTPSSVQVTKGVWHELQVRLLINGSAGQTEVWLDGNRINALSKTESFGTDQIGRLQLGEKDAGVNFDVAYDYDCDAQLIPYGTAP